MSTQVPKRIRNSTGNRNARATASLRSRDLKADGP
jgi:hypothetical protein